MTRKSEQREELKNIMEELTKEGFKCFILKENHSFVYGFIITPNDNVIYIQPGDFFGWNLSLKYKPSQKNGQGCRCNEEPLTEINSDIILKQEQEGLNFARKLRATLYNNSEEYLNNLWNTGEYEEV